MGGIIVSAGLIGSPPQEVDWINKSSYIFPSSILSFQGAVMIWAKKMKNIFLIPVLFKEAVVMVFISGLKKDVKIRK
jgi:hypothetical protein